NGLRITLSTHEVINGERKQVDAEFRAYETDLDSFQDRVRFLKQNKRYKSHGVFEAKTPAAQAQALQEAGYATDPHYAQKLIQLMDKHNLYTLDLSDEDPELWGMLPLMSVQ
ncbi:MAG TPA: glucosaminidase domain-containing protein, partial [Chryseolinea sp.]|nr:glucosaminidase domain-containing protein [Chryseolinea sp.]